MWFPAQLSELYRILSYVRDHAQQAGLGSKDLHRLELVCEEAVVNVMHHAFPDQVGAIGILCEVHPNRFDVILRDQGIPFNPTVAVVPAETRGKDSETTIGGVGLCLIRQLLDEVIYVREGNENILRLSIHCTASHEGR